MLRTVAFSLATIAFTVEARTVKLDLSAATTANARLATFSSAAASTGASTGLGVVRQHRLTAGAAKVTGLAVGDEVVFTLFEDKELTVTLTKEMPSLTGRSFLGRIDNVLGALGCVVLETEAGIVLDVTDFEHDRVWQVVSEESGVTVREVQPSHEGKCGGDTLEPPSGRAPVSVSVSTQNGVTTVVTNAPTADAGSAIPKVACSDVASVPTVAEAVALAGTSGKTTVDILINYDTDAATWAKSNGGGLTTFAETTVQKMNTALANTGLDSYFQFRLVGIYEVGGSAGGNLTYALYYASGSYSGTLNGVSWSGVAAERERVHADIVCTLCDNGTAYGTVGLGWALKETSDCASCGFNACQIRSVAQSHTMTHEVGHNMGAGHSDMMKDSSNCGPQFYTYSSGYYFYVDSIGYYTIMAYNADGYGNYYTSVPYFSSPDYKYLGVAVGDATHNNSKTLQLNCEMVANNRNAPYESSEIGQGFEAEAYTWTTDGTYPWTRVTDSSNDGIDSSRSCEMSGSSTSWAETEVVGPATMTFKLRLRTYRGWFNVLTDGVISYTYGDSSTAYYGYSWESVSVSIPSGTHTVRLAYTHNNSGFNSGGNGAWVDQLQFVGGSPPSDVVTHTVTFNLGSHGYRSGGGALVQTVNDGEAATAPTVTAYAGYNWTGWDKTFSSVKGDLTVNATYSLKSYTITYANLKGATNPSNNPSSYTVESSIVFAALPNVSGYHFTGWSPASISTGTTGNKTITAQWEEIIGIGAALDNTALSFTTGGTAEWFGQSSTTHDGSDALRSGAISHNQTSYVQTTVTGPGKISFWWYASSESASYDYLFFSIDDVQQSKIGGTSCSWTQCSYDVSAGTHTLKWTYRKDDSVSSGQDAGFLDQVVWAPEKTEFPYKLVSGKAVITNYTGSATDIVFPATVDGYAVSEIAATFDFFDHPFRTVTISEGIGKISAGAFRYQTLLETVAIPSTLTSLKYGNGNDFYGCLHLRRIDVASGNATYKSDDGVLYNKSGTTLVCRPCAHDSGASFTVPSGVTKIADYAFCHNSHLARLELPSGLAEIGAYAFYSASALVELDVASDVSDMGSFALAGCSSLERLVLRGQVASTYAAKKWGSGLASDRVWVKNADYTYWTGVFDSDINVLDPITEFQMSIPGSSGVADYLMTLEPKGTYVYIPGSWLSERGVDVSKGAADALNATGKNGIPRYQSYLLGLEPESDTPASEQLKPEISFDEDGLPVITCTPCTSYDYITYTTLGKDTLTDTVWREVTDDNRAGMKFFKVRVDIK